MPEIIDDKDPRTIEGMKELQRRMALYLRVPRALDHQSVQELKQLIYDFRVWFKQRYAVTFPELVPMVLPSIGKVKFFRADWPNLEIHRNLLFLIEDLKRTGTPISAIELAAAVQQAWPHYRPPIDELKTMVEKVH
jgi:hypothetical protein